MSKHMNRNTHPFKAFLYGMGFGALLMFILLFPGQVKAFDEIMMCIVWHKTFILKLVVVTLLIK